MAFVRVNAGLKPKAPHYGGWDNGGASTVGHYLSACSHMYAATGDVALKKRIDYVVAEMADAQKASGDGGLFAFGYDHNVYFAKMRKGDLLPNRVNGWYLTHKLMAGLRDAYVEGGSAQARDVLQRQCDWCLDVTRKLTDSQWQTMLDGEHGAPHEIVADMYAWTDDRKYLNWAEKWRHHLVFEPLAKNEDAVLNGLHANETIPKFVGYERVYELNDDPVWHETAKNFWNKVVERRTWASGGDGQWEHFFDPGETGKKLTEVCGPETCATYNMVKLTRQLFQIEPSTRYVDFYERALYNGILPSQSPEGGFVYYTSMRPGNYRVFSRPFDAFWCCVGTGMENHGKYGELIYAHKGNDRLFVNLFIPSVLTWKEAGLTLRQETTFPVEPRTRLTVETPTPKRMTLSVRYPGWVAPNALTVQVNGKPVALGGATSGGFVDIARVWKSGDWVEIGLPMTLSSEPAPDAPDYAAFFYGPVLLAGALGQSGLTHADFYGGGDNTDINNQLARKELPDDETPVLVGTAENARRQITPVPGKPLTFRLAGDAIQPHPITLIPFYDLHLQRYAVYWPTRTPEAYASQKEAARREASRQIDHVVVGDAVSEASHALQSSGSHSGGAGGGQFPHWRDATGFFGYTLRVAADSSPTLLQCAFWGGDTGRAFDILIDGQKLATVQLTAAKPNEFILSDFPIPAAQTQGHRSVVVRFQPRPNSVAGGLFDLRTLRP